MFGRKIYLMVILLLLNSCIVLSGNQVKLSKFPNPTKNEAKKLSIAYDFYQYDYEINIDKERHSSFLGTGSNLRKLGIQDIDKTFSTPNCKIRIATKHLTNDNPSKGNFAYQYIAATTFYLLPYVWKHPYEVKAELISTKDNKVLKKYYLKENSYDIRSAVFFILAALYPPNWYEDTGDRHRYNPAPKISKAITRQIVSDALGFEECLK